MRDISLFEEKIVPYREQSFYEIKYLQEIASKFGVKHEHMAKIKSKLYVL